MMHSASTQIQADRCPISAGNASNSSKLRRLRRRYTKGNKRRRAILSTVQAATTAQSLNPNLGSVSLPQEPDARGQQSTWNAFASRLSRRLQRHRAEDHLPLCKAFGVSTLEELRVRASSSI